MDSLLAIGDWHSSGSHFIDCPCVLYMFSYEECWKKIISACCCSKVLSILFNLITPALLVIIASRVEFPEGQMSNWTFWAMYISAYIRPLKPNWYVCLGSNAELNLQINEFSMKRAHCTHAHYVNLCFLFGVQIWVFITKHLGSLGNKFGLEKESTDYVLQCWKVWGGLMTPKVRRPHNERRCCGWHKAD